MADEIDVASLTTCEVAPDGQFVRLNLADARGQPVTLRVPVPCTQQLLMTLPRLLTQALRAQYGNRSVKAVFPLEIWRLETTHGSQDLILTMTTADGFEASFSVEPRAVAEIVFALQEHLATAEAGKSTVLS
jgi:hypothetical protein